MKLTSKFKLSCFALLLLVFAAPAFAQSEKRIAFVVGNAAYPAAPLATAANDAGLIAQTLQAAGFDVSGARDLDGESLRAAFRDFLDKAQASGPDTVAFVYLAGYGLQLEGENYFVPVDAKIASAQDVPVEALRVSDYTKRLTGLPLKASFIVLDAARDTPFAKSGPPLAGGLALADAEPKMLVAFNATPGTIAPAENGPYGAYARALTEMIREGGLPPSDVFDGVRLRVNEETKGAQVPWDASRIAVSVVFFERAADAPPPAIRSDRMNAMRSQPLGDFGAGDAYAAAIEQDTLQGYEEFLAAYPGDPLANRVRALLAARREALVWRRTCHVGTPDAYWSYLSRYPRGPHAADARWRLDSLAAAMEPPPSFVPIEYDVPPPPPAEIVYVDRPVLVFSDPGFGFVPPPPVAFLAPVPAYLVFPPPPPPVGLFVLPSPAFVPVPTWVNPPAYVAAPPGNVIFNNIHTTTVINNTNLAAPSGGVGAGVAAGLAAGAAAGAIAAKIALPPSVARRASAVEGQGAPGIGASQPGPGTPLGAAGAPPVTHLPAGHELPGRAGNPLPSGPSQKPGAPAAQPAFGQALPGANGQPGEGLGQRPGTPAGAQPSNHVLPGTAGHQPGQGLVAKPGTSAGQPSAGHAFPGAIRPPQPSGTGAKTPTAQQALPHAPQTSPGAASPNRLPTAHVAPGGHAPPSVTGGSGTPTKPGPVTPPGGPSPAAQQTRNNLPAGNPVFPVMPKPQIQQPHPPQQAQQKRLIPPVAQGLHPPQPQQARQQGQSKPKQDCGKPGLPACH